MRRRCSRPSSSPSRYLDEITANVTDEQIRANEAMYSERLRSMTASLPQLRDLWIIGADGYPLVSGTVYPMPRIDLSDRNYFKSHHDNPVNGPMSAEVLDAARRQHQASSRSAASARSTAGSPASRIVSIAPEYFSEFYSQLPPPGAATLLRADGAVLARYPDYPGAQTRLPAERTVHDRRSRRGRSRASSPRRPRSTAASASSPTSSWRSCPTLYVTVGVEAGRRDRATGCSPWRAI